MFINICLNVKIHYMVQQTIVLIPYCTRQTKFVTGCDPTDGKSTGIGATRSSLLFIPPFPASSKPFLQSLANLSGRNVEQLLVVNKSPPSLIKGVARATNSAMSLFTLHRFFFLPTLVQGGSRMTISNFSPRFTKRLSQSKPIDQ